MYGGRPVSLYGCALALVVAVLAGAAPSSAQFFESIEFDDATALVMQGNLVNGPNASCDSAGDEVPHPGTFVFRNNDPGADYLYQSYDLYNNGPTRCVQLQVKWVAQDCNPLQLGLALYLDSFNPADPRQNLLAHSYFFEHSFGFGDPRHWNDYYYSPGFYHDGVQAYHLDTIHLGAEVPALAKVVAVLDSLEQPGDTATCPINSATASLHMRSDELSDEPLTVEIHDSSSYELGTLTFFVYLSRQFTESFSIDYDSAPGSAVQADFTATSGQLTFAPGETFKLIQVPLVDDPDQEPTEQMTMTLSNPSPSGVGITQAIGTGTIFDNDDPFASCHVTTLPPGPLPAGTVGVDYGPLTLAGSGSDTIDFEWTLDSGTLPPGIELTETLSSPVQGIIAGTPTQAGDYTFTIELLCHLTDNGLETVDLEYSIHIEPEQPQVLITLDDLAVVEGHNGITPALPLIRLSAALPDDLLLEVQTFDSSATAADPDYNAVPPAQQILIPQGITEQPIPLEVIGDFKVENDELFLVQLVTPIGKNFIASADIGVINDDFPQQTQEIPTLGSFGLALLASALAGMAVWAVRRS